MYYFPEIYDQRNIIEYSLSCLTKAGESFSICSRVTMEVIGCALKTADNEIPVFVSVGHNIDLETAKYLVFNMMETGRRLPEPTYGADFDARKAVGQTSKSEYFRWIRKLKCEKQASASEKSSAIKNAKVPKNKITERDSVNNFFSLEISRETISKTANIKVKPSVVKPGFSYANAAKRISAY